MQEPAGTVDVATEEGGGHQRNGQHHLGGREPDLLGIVGAAVDGFEEVVAQAVDGDYGIVQVVLPI